MNADGAEKGEGADVKKKSVDGFGKSGTVNQDDGQGIWKGTEKKSVKERVLGIGKRGEKEEVRMGKKIVADTDTENEHGFRVLPYVASIYSSQEHVCALEHSVEEDKDEKPRAKVRMRA